MKFDTDFKVSLSQDLYFIRGVAIALVVIGHVIGTKDYGGGIYSLYHSTPPFLEGLLEFTGLIYTFHMPLFFIASGIAFTVFSDRNTSYAKFTKNKIKRLLIPLVCWAPPLYIADSLINGKHFSVFDTIVNSIIYPFNIFWFLHALIFTSFFSFFLLKLTESELKCFLISVILFLLSFCFRRINIDIFYGGLYYNLLYTFGLFAACSLPRTRLVLSRLHLSVRLLVLSVFTLTLMVGYIMTTNPPISLIKLVNGITGFYLLYALTATDKIPASSKLINAGLSSVKSAFIYLGRVSLGIYLLHRYFQSGTRHFLVKAFGSTDVSLHLILGFSVAIVGSILIYKLLQTNRIFMYSMGEGK